ncbi:MAG: ACT domain-containing protein, partial [Rhizobiaceae bacterium]
MLYTTNRDVPGIIGKLGGLFASADVNIANFYLGRDKEGGDAIALVELDEPVTKEFLKVLENTPEIASAKKLEFTL